MSDSAAPNRFEATAAALGYLYQLRYGLLLAFAKFQNGVDWEIGIEAGDDLEVSNPADTTYLQLKHHSGAKNLTDRSSDLWKTLRVWSESYNSFLSRSSKFKLLLVTTANVVDGSIASFLRAEDRDEQKALQLLNRIALETNQTNSDAYASFVRLSDSQRRELISRIEVVDGTVDITAVGEELRRLGTLSVSRTNVAAFLGFLEGWWLRRCITYLASPEPGGVSGIEFDEALDQARQQFGPESLPVSPDIFDLDPTLAEYHDRTFVQQLDWIEIGQPRIRVAVREYLRAFTQRSMWARDQLLRVGEIESYERRLVEEWEIVFEQRKEDLGPEAAGEDCTRCAREIYKWVEQVANYPIRKNCEQEFITRGSYQMLSDAGRVGWHIDFQARLMELLEPAPSSQQ